MSEQTLDPTQEPAQKTTVLEKVKTSVPVIAMTAGAGIAGGGLLDEQLADIITDITKALGAAWLQHPSSWAGVIIGTVGFIFHIRHMNKIQGDN